MLSVVRSAHGDPPVRPPLQAQRGGGGFHGGGPGKAVGNGFGRGSRPGFPNGSVPHYARYHRFRNYGLDFATWYYPDWDEGEPLEFYPESESSLTSPPAAAPQVVIVESHDYRPPAPATEGPKLIEAPQTKGTAAASKPETPTLFVFASGERLEARRYTLTVDSLRIEIGRQQRRVPLSEINVDATIAANRERGIDLKIPTDRNEIFLGF